MHPVKNLWLRKVLYFLFDAQGRKSVKKCQLLFEVSFTWSSCKNDLLWMLHYSPWGIKFYFVNCRVSLIKLFSFELSTCSWMSIFLIFSTFPFLRSNRVPQRSWTLLRTFEYFNWSTTSIRKVNEVTFLFSCPASKRSRRLSTRARSTQKRIRSVKHCLLSIWKQGPI